MSKVYVLLFDTENGPFVNWGIDKDDTTDVEVINCEFFHPWPGISVDDTRYWLIDQLNEVSLIDHAPTRQTAVDFVCSEMPHGDDFTTEDELRTWVQENKEVK